MNGEQRPGWYFARAQDDLNVRILRMLEDTFSLDAAQTTAVANLRETDTSGEGTLSELFLRLPFKEALKGKNLLLRRAHPFLLEKIFFP